MAKLILKYEASVLKEFKLNKPVLSIGRAAGNDIVIDNMAVSGQHAKLLLEDGRFVVEDLNSLNGTFLNNQRIRKSPLQDGDEILIGKHTLRFQDEGIANIPVPMVPGWEAAKEEPHVAEQTVVLDTQRRREFLAKATSIATEGASEAASKIACLVTLKGKTNQKEYILTSKLCIIGKDSRAFVQVRHWFTPKVAAIITRRGNHFEISPSEKAKATRLNSQPLSGPQELKEGDLIQVGKAQLQFYFRE